MTLVDSSLAAKDGRLVVLAPARRDVPRSFRIVENSASRYEALLAQMQRLRGTVYLSDGAIEPWHVSADGRHRLDIDEDSWHLLSVGVSGTVCGCARLRTHASTATFGDLWIRSAALASFHESRQKVRAAVESEMETARRRAVGYAEVGGWAIAKERRCTMEAVRIALATFSLAQILGGCLGITTATVRHCSSSILRRMGGSPLQHDGVALAPYYDPQFKCEMEMLRFDSSRPNPRYQAWVERMRVNLLSAPVVCGNRSLTRGFEPAWLRETAPQRVLEWRRFATA